MKFRVFSALLCAISWCATAQTTYNSSPTRSFGPARLSPVSTGNPNLVEGRELYLPQSVALDTTSNPPIVYVADNSNHRVLAWKNSASFNNGDIADLVIGQKDLFSTFAGGPAVSGSPSGGLRSPSGVVVDSAGNLYVADGGNNRILRYPKPFSAPGGMPSPDLVIGQTSLSSSASPNQGQSTPSSNSLSIGVSGASAPIGMAFDSQGNLWVTDFNNNRVLRFSAGSLSSGSPNADVVLGQPNSSSNSSPSGTDRTPFNKRVIVAPTSLAFSQAGDLYVADSFARVLYFPSATLLQGVPTRVLGVLLPNKSNPQPSALNGCPANPDASCGTKIGAAGSSGATPAQGLTVIANQVYVADTNNNRIMVYDRPDRWPAECAVTPGQTTQQDCPTGTAFSPSAIAFIGQNNSPAAVKPNLGLRAPTAMSLYGPVGLTSLNADLWVADANNNRVLVFPAATPTSATASRVLGQYDMTMSAPNLIEGRELFNFLSTSTGLAGNAVVDSNNRLYISDTFNNRVLGFSDYRKVVTGSKADIVIGQRDLTHGLVNSGSADGSVPTSSGLQFPTGLAVDGSGNLWVADSGNGRVLRFRSPFDQHGTISADLVLGKSGMSVRPGDQSDPTSTTMRGPYGLAFTQNGSLAVSDVLLNRVLVFKKPAGDFSSGQAADIVLGQTDFNSGGAGSGVTQLNQPRGIALDSGDRLYVADTSNNRLTVFGGSGGLVSLPNGSGATLTQAVSSAPYSVAVSLRTGEIWVTAGSSNQVIRYPVYDQLVLNPGQNISTLAASFPFGVALDPFDNPIVSDAVNRVSFYHPLARPRNAASYNRQRFTPGMLTYLEIAGPRIPGSDIQAQSLPFPTTLGDVQVTVNGTAAPIIYVIAGNVVFQIPWETPASGDLSVTVSSASTGQVYGSYFGAQQLAGASPAFFTSNQAGSGSIAALLADGQTVNSNANPAPVGTVVALYGTGIGPVSGNPATGAPAQGLTPAPEPPRVFINGRQAEVQYFGLAPGLVGGFQMNVVVPKEAAAATNPGQVPVVFLYKDIPNNLWILPGESGVSCTPTGQTQPYCDTKNTIWIKF